MEPLPPAVAPASTPKHANRYNRMEWAGAFGDLGTLIPFTIAYIGAVKMDPYGVLLAFGLAMIVCGAVYRTPFPVQPMKAAGAVAATQAAQSFVITPNVVLGAGLATGLIWLVLGLSGAAQKLATLIPRAITVGIVLGLGIAFMIEGARHMSGNWWLGAPVLLGALCLLSNRVVPVMFLLLLAGAGASLLTVPDLAARLTEVSIEPRFPQWAFGSITLDDLLIGTVFLALPQLPLTFGNAIVAVTEENNRLFPDRPVSERKVAISTGLMNVAGAAIGGVPMCHGAGGMAGHVRFGAMTGGAPIILGVLLVATAVLFSGSVATLLQLFHPVILGVILFLTGAQLALGSCDFGRDKGERFVTLVTAALAVWNVGLAFLLGILIYLILKRGWARL